MRVIAKRSLVVTSMLMIVFATAHATWAAAPEGEAAVESGKQAFNQFWDYPWYDASTDQATPIDVTPPPPPAPPSNSNFNWSTLFTVLQWLGWITFILIIALVIYLMLRSEWARISSQVAVDERPGESGPIQPDRVEELPFKLVQPNKDFYSSAEEYYREGDYSTAILYLYSYKLLELDRSQVIHLTRGKTNRQYLRETRRYSAAGPLLEPTMIAFEEVFFGHHRLTRERFEACWSVVPEFKAAISQLTVPSALAPA